MLGFLKSNKKSIITILSTALSCILLLCAFTGIGSQQAQSENVETVYRESTVQRGNITVGITETATATLKSYSLSYDVTAELDEVFVKAGQTVREGDPIASISTTSIREEISSLSANYQEAVLELSEAELAKQKGELEAQNTYDSSVNKSDTATDTYEMTVEKLERAITTAEKEISEINSEIKVYNAILGYSFGSERYYDFVESSYYSAKYDKNFEDETDVVLAKEDAQERLEEAELALKEAEYNLAVQQGEAVLTRDKTLSSAELAEIIYEMELKSLANDVTSKQLAMDNIQEQIDKYNGYLDATILIAPCDGVVTSVSYDAGVEVQSGTAVATISDSNRVFVYIAVAQDDITSVSLGQSCTVAMDAFEALSFDGVVDSITTTPARSASGSANYNVTIQLIGDTAQVYEGMTGSATLITRQQKDVLYVTNRTIYEKDGQSYVKVKNEDDSIEEVAVTTGFSDGRNVEITKGLTEGQTVLIESQVAAQQ